MPFHMDKVIIEYLVNLITCPERVFGVRDPLLGLVRDCGGRGALTAFALVFPCLSPTPHRSVFLCE